MFAIIGGTGVGSALAREPGFGLKIPTAHGLFSARRLQWCVAVERHGLGHKLPPHRVNYLAMAEGLARMGVEGCFATAAVGAITPTLLPGQLAVCADFLDLSGRHTTLFDSFVSHTDFTEPVNDALSNRLHGAALDNGLGALPSVVYACMNGPRYETPHEIATLQKLGCDVVGMTAASEAIAMREAGISYACLAIVTNAAAASGAATLAHNEVAEVMKDRTSLVLQILKAAVQS